MYRDGKIPGFLHEDNYWRGDFAMINDNSRIDWTRNGNSGIDASVLDHSSSNSNFSKLYGGERCSTQMLEPSQANPADSRSGFS